MYNFQTKVRAPGYEDNVQSNFALAQNRPQSQQDTVLIKHSYLMCICVIGRVYACVSVPDLNDVASQ